MRISDWSSDVCSSDLIPAQTSGLYGCQAMMDVVQQVHVPAQRFAGGLEQFGDDAKIFGRVPDIFGRQVGVGGFVEIFVLRPAIGRRHARHRSEEHTSELQSLMRTSYAVFSLNTKKKDTDTQSKTN